MIRPPGGLTAVRSVRIYVLNFNPKMLATLRWCSPSRQVWKWCNSPLIAARSDRLKRNGPRNRLAEVEQMAHPAMVFVALLDEGTAVWRPVAAEPVGSGIFRLAGLVPDGESWEFQPGETVRCVEHSFSDGSYHLVATARIID